MDKIVTLAEADINSVEMVTLIKVEFNRGAGIKGDPVRRIVQYWTTEGKLLVEKDGWTERDKLRDIGETPTST